jgi:phosphoglycerate kinase
MKGAKIHDSRRNEASYKTIDAVLKKKATPKLSAHLGDGTESLRPVAAFLSKRYGIVFIDRDIADKSIHAVLAMVPKGTVVLLENIRRYEGEEKNSKAFAKVLAALGKYYINDAFSVSHRAHASVVGLPALLPHFAGYRLEAEILALSTANEGSKHPFAFILGGAKFSTKIPLLSKFADRADSIIIGGAILNNFYKAAGFEVGDSVIESGYDKQIKALLANPKLLLPVDVIVTRSGKSKTVGVDEVQKGDVIVDIGPRSVELISVKIAKAKLVVWNGPMGWYEKKFTKGTVGLAKAIIGSKAQAVIGGGDTGAVIEKILTKPTKRVFISTGGGAALDYLAKGTLPGIDALK